MSEETKYRALSALKVRDFRLYWTGLVSQIGGQHMFQFALGWLAFEITGSQAQLGLIHLCAFVPQFAFTMFGGVMADRVDPRKLIAFAQTLLASGILFVGTMTLLGHVQLWHLALGAFMIGLSNSIDEPSRAAFFPRLLPKAQLRSAVPLVSMAFGGSRIIAPSIAGFLIAAAGASTTFMISALCVSMMIAVVLLVRPSSGSGPSHGSLIDNLSDSVRYIRSNEAFYKVILAALLNATFCMGYSYMLPVFAKDILGVDSRGLGFLVSAAGIGSLCGLLSYTWLQAHTTPRNAMVYALSGFCCALIGFSLSGRYWLSFAMLFCAGLTQAYFMTSCQVILQTLVEDSYRGRVMGVFTQVWSLMYLSGFLLNYAGSLMGPGPALMCGGSIVLAYVWLSLVRSSALRVLTLTPRAA